MKTSLVTIGHNTKLVFAINMSFFLKCSDILTLKNS